MKRIVVLLVLAVLLSGSVGCTVVQDTEVLAEAFPHKHWEKVWIIQERKTEMTIDSERAVMKGYCQVLYQGEEPAEDVQIIIRSPLTYDLIDQQNAWQYGKVDPGRSLEYIMHAEYDDWKDIMSTYIFENKLRDDYQRNYYVGISWRYGEEHYHQKFFDWSDDKK